ncbi:fructosamine kinase family protein [Rapidithrix thailandica]|uniref:Fructosamine kinase family protein n=1 Tax=Rapidithrix thailandica TaxID=413964 RepID=A0AAW9S3E9_9BACT
MNWPHSKSFFENALTNVCQNKPQIRTVKSLGGGCINQAVRLSTDAGEYFLKYNPEKALHFFEVEAKGLQLLANTQTVKVPQVIGYGKTEDKAYLVLEFLESRYPEAFYWENFGRQLARLHQHSEQAFGLSYANYIGALPQENDWKFTWEEFFFEKRLNIQFELALQNGLIDYSYLKKLEKLRSRLVDFFPVEKPSLLHGDLWSGNAMIGPGGQACVVDPAVYFGHREIELAFTRLFGGFEPEFYEAYQEVFPLQQGFEERVDIYNIYPLMVHVNLFGKSYLRGIDTVLQRML